MNLIKWGAMGQRIRYSKTILWQQHYRAVNTFRNNIPYVMYTKNGSYRYEHSSTWNYTYIHNEYETRHQNNIQNLQHSSQNIDHVKARMLTNPWNESLIISSDMDDVIVRFIKNHNTSVRVATNIKQHDQLKLRRLQHASKLSNAFSSP